MKKNLILLFASTIALGATAGDIPSDNTYHVGHPKAEVLKILSVFEGKMGSQKIVEKAKDKLATLSNEQTLLIASLSELMVKDSETAGADLAFLFATMLIILS